jgi:hypothetical protein
VTEYVPVRTDDRLNEPEVTVAVWVTAPMLSRFSLVRTTVAVGAAEAVAPSRSLTETVPETTPKPAGISTICPVNC